MTVSSEPNMFQTYLIPEKSHYVRWLARKAGEASLSDSGLEKRCLSIIYAITAVVISIFNTFSYFLQIFIKIPLNVVRFDPCAILFDPFKDLTRCMLSLVFAAFGVTYIFWGFVKPEVFLFFAPPDTSPEKTIADLSKRVQILERENGQFRQMLGY